MSSRVLPGFGLIVIFFSLIGGLGNLGTSGNITLFRIGFLILLFLFISSKKDIYKIKMNIFNKMIFIFWIISGLSFLSYFFLNKYLTYQWNSMIVAFIRFSFYLLFVTILSKITFSLKQIEKLFWVLALLSIPLFFLILFQVGHGFVLPSLQFRPPSSLPWGGLMRADGFMNDPNYFSMYINLYIWFTIFLFLKFKKWYLGIIIFLEIVILFLTFSRSGILAFFISFLFFTFLYWGIEKAILKTGMIFLLITGLFFIFITITYPYISKNKENFWDGIKHRFTHLDKSSLTRVDQANATWNIVNKSPILGIGFGNSQNLKNMKKFYSEHPYSSEINIVHNNFLSMLAESGIFAFLIYLALIFLLLKKTYNMSRNANSEIMRRYSLILFSAFIGILVQSFFINTLLFPPHWVIIALILQNIQGQIIEA